MEAMDHQDKNKSKSSSSSSSSPVEKESVKLFIKKNKKHHLHLTRLGRLKRELAFDNENESDTDTDTGGGGEKLDNTFPLALDEYKSRCSSKISHTRQSNLECGDDVVAVRESILMTEIPIISVLEDLHTPYNNVHGENKSKVPTTTELMSTFSSWPDVSPLPVRCESAPARMMTTPTPRVHRKKTKPITVQPISNSNNNNNNNNKQPMNGLVQISSPIIAGVGVRQEQQQSEQSEQCDNESTEEVGYCDGCVCHWLDCCHCTDTRWFDEFCCTWSDERQDCRYCMCIGPRCSKECDRRCYDCIFCTFDIGGD